MQNENNHNLFFGPEVVAPWPTSLPEGRVLPETSRHLTFAFLGKVSTEKLLSQLKDFPLPPSPLSAAGVCDKLLVLPENDPHVIAYHVHWLTQQEELLSFRQSLYDWLISLGYTLDKRPFLSHVTVARAPFNEKEWRKHFTPLPLMTKDLHLYVSSGNLTYEPIWTYPMTPPFVEISHTGDIAYKIYGKDATQVSLHAQLALAFECLDFLPLIASRPVRSIEEIVIGLNDQVSTLDQERGSPFKGVSFHGELVQENGLFTWEMIVDV